MRIAYIINSMEGGGAQSPLPRIVQALKAAGADARVLALARRNGKALPRLEAAGIKPLIFSGGETDHLAALRWIAQHVAEFNSDALFTSLTRATLLGQVVGQRKALPIVSWQHNAFLKPWNERLLRWRAGKSDLWVADSSSVADLTRQRLRLANHRCFTWPIFAADPDAIQAIPWQPGNPIALGSLGRLHSAKGYDYLFAALLKLQHAGWRPPAPLHLSIAGTGDQESELRALASGITIAKIEFAGFVSDPAQYLGGLHLYLQPSRREGFCIAAHEAMQAGLPIVASATGEMPKTISADCGLTVPVGNVDALASSLAKMLAEPASLAKRGAAARQRVLSQFSQSAFDEGARYIVDRLKAVRRAS